MHFTYGGSLICTVHSSKDRVASILAVKLEQLHFDCTRNFLVFFWLCDFCASYLPLSEYFLLNTCVYSLDHFASTHTLIIEQPSAEATLL